MQPNFIFASLIAIGKTLKWTFTPLTDTLNKFSIKSVLQAWYNLWGVLSNSTHLFNTKKPFLLSPKNPSVQHLKLLSSTPKNRQYVELNGFWCWTEGFWLLKRCGLCVELRGSVWNWGHSSWAWALCRK